MSKTMNAVAVTDAFGLENLRLIESDPGKPGRGQVLVHFGYASLNYRDLLMVTGQYNPRQPLPLIPCSDGSGTVVEVGEGCSLKPGQRVATLFSQSWSGGRLMKEHRDSTLGGPLDGTLREAGVFPETGLIPIPDDIDSVTAATLPCAALTAWSALVTQARVKTGDTVLLQGTGGVSLFALQFAKAMGLRVIMTSSSDEKLERVSEMGADVCINYVEHPRWSKEVRKHCPDGVDLVVEVGGAATIQQSLNCLRLGGQVSMIGVLSGTVSDLNIIPVIMSGLQIKGILVGSRDGFTEMLGAIQKNHIRAVVDRHFELSEAKQAFEHMASGQHFGKIVIDVS